MFTYLINIYKQPSITILKNNWSKIIYTKYDKKDKPTQWKIIPIKMWNIAV